jgi:hypothetical protein
MVGFAEFRIQAVMMRNRGVQLVVVAAAVVALVLVCIAIF